MHKSRRPSLPILFVTGFADRGALARIDDAHMVGKPFVHDELAAKVRAAVGLGASGNVIKLRR